MGEKRDIDQEGRVTPHAIHELKQLYGDLRTVFPDFTFHAEWKQIILSYKGDVSEVLSYQEVRTPRSAAIPRNVPDPRLPSQHDLFYEDTEGVPMHTCPTCNKHFDNPKKLMGHMLYAHKYRAPEHDTLLDRTCLKCGRTFGRVDSALRHVRLNRDREVCASSKKGKPCRG